MFKSNKDSKNLNLKPLKDFFVFIFVIYSFITLSSFCYLDADNGKISSALFLGCLNLYIILIGIMYILIGFDIKFFIWISIAVSIIFSLSFFVIFNTDDGIYNDYTNTIQKISNNLTAENSKSSLISIPKGYRVYKKDNTFVIETTLLKNKSILQNVIFKAKHENICKNIYIEQRKWFGESKVTCVLYNTRGDARVDKGGRL